MTSNTAMRLSADNLRLIHEIAMLPSQDVSPFVDDYFAAGGDMQAVAQWLHISGGVLRGQHVAGLHAAGLIAGIRGSISSRRLMRGRKLCTSSCDRGYCK